MNLFELAQYVEMPFPVEIDPLDVDCPDCGALAGRPCREIQRDEIIELH